MMFETITCHNILVAYYSFTGNTRRVAEAVREKTCGVLYAVEPDQLYSKDTVVKQTRQELETGNYPKLRRSIPSMLPYDVIMVGGPVRWQTLSAPVIAFCNGADFAGKKVAPFCTHEGVLGEYFQDFTRLVKDGDIQPGFEINVASQSAQCLKDGSVEAWLDRIGIPRRHTGWDCQAQIPGITN